LFRVCSARKVNTAVTDWPWRLLSVTVFGRLIAKHSFSLCPVSRTRSSLLATLLMSLFWPERGSPRIRLLVSPSRSPRSSRCAVA